MGLDVLGNQNHWVIRLYEAIYYIILYCIILYCIILYCIVLYYYIHIQSVYISHPKRSQKSQIIHISRLRIPSPHISHTETGSVGWEKNPVAGLNEPDFSRMETSIHKNGQKFVVHGYRHGYLPS